MLLANESQSLCSGTSFTKRGTFLGEHLFDTPADHFVIIDCQNPQHIN
jgi:hypothetical protein